MRHFVFLAVIAFGLTGCAHQQKVGYQGQGNWVVATEQWLRPTGIQIGFNGRPIDLCLSPDGKTVFVKDNRGLVVIDAITKRVKQELAVKGGTSLCGIVATGDGVWISGAGDTLSHATLKDGAYAWNRTITLPKASVGGAPFPCGMLLNGDDLIVAASRDNSVYVYSAASGGQKRRIQVGIAPYALCLEPGGTLLVSCWGRSPKDGTRAALSSGSEVEVDERTVATGGEIVRVDVSSGTVLAREEVAQQPMQILVGSEIYVAHGNADHVTVLDPRTLAEKAKINAKPAAGIPFGSMPGAIALSADGKTLYTANGGDNAVGVFEVESRKARGFLPVGWCPGALLIRERAIWVANIKGNGSEVPRKADGMLNVHAHKGTISVVPFASPKELKEHTKTVLAGINVGEALANLERGQAKLGKPIPEKLGERSPIEHVVYVIKENRTYDQIFGDLPQGDGNKDLCIFGRDITPNHHALAEQFVLLDNFYCNGVLSADGHTWATSGAVTGYLERSFGGFSRSYPYGGNDALNPPQSGYLWDRVLGAGLSFHCFGEFDLAQPSAKRSWRDLYEEHATGQRSTGFVKKIEVERVKQYSDPEYPGWNMGIPEQIRADIFMDRFAKMTTMANLTIIYLPQDHTSGATPGEPTPQACVADNDLALGRIVEALSHSKWWPKMAIFVVEDDPQAGFDHVDGHRSPALVIGPHVRRKEVVSQFFNQTSVLHTISRIFGLTPGTQFEAAMPPMFACFQDKADLTPFQCLPATYEINTLNPSKEKANALQKRLIELTAQQDLSEPDRITDDTMNRIIWHAIRGDERYPAEWAGAHGRGLAQKGLKMDWEEED